MTDALMQQRVMSQLRTRPPGWEGTASEIAAQMDGKLTGSQIEPTLRLFEVQGMVTRAFRRTGQRGPDHWRLLS